MMRAARAAPLTRKSPTIMTFDPEKHCPVCGVANSCEIAEGRGNCWCFATKVNEDLLELLADQGIEDRCLCATCAAGKVPSPCARTCEYDEADAQCSACGRTREEIASWARRTPAERATVLLRLRGLLVAEN